MNRLLKGIANFFPSSNTGEESSDAALKDAYHAVPQCVPPGHFYSPVPSPSEIKKDEQRIFQIPAALPGIDLNEAEQLRFFHAFKEFYRDMPFRRRAPPGFATISRMQITAFSIVFFNTYLEHFYREQFAESMPLCLKNPGGSLWIRKL